jgi:D-hexose-6-phosphate mutarotase
MLASCHGHLDTVSVLQATVENLGEQLYLDNLDSRARKTQPTGPLRFDREVDRIYVGAPEDIKVELTTVATSRR